MKFAIVFLIFMGQQILASTLDLVYTKLPTLHLRGQNAASVECTVDVRYTFKPKGEPSDDQTNYFLETLSLRIKTGDHVAAYMARYNVSGNGPQCPDILENSEKVLVVKNHKEEYPWPGPNSGPRVCGKFKQLWGFRLEKLDKATRYAVETDKGEVWDCTVPDIEFPKDK